MNVLILGPQGSGKGTQARRLAEEFGLYYFDMGAFLRKAAKTDSQLDKYVNKEGKFLPEEVSNPLAFKHLDEKVPTRDGIFLDGFPRSLKQLEAVNAWFAEKGKKIDQALYLTISEDESVRRLSARRFCTQCGKIYNLITKPPKKDNQCDCGGDLYHREDDKPEAIKRRLAWSKELNKAILAALGEQGVLHEVDGEQAIEAIHEELKELLLPHK